MKNIHAERVEKIQALMERDGIDLYYIPMDDCHNSEYVGTHFKTIEYVSGFTGSAASIVIAKDGAWLWTDGRYFLQADMELEGSGITLMKSGQDGIPEKEDFINSRVSGSENPVIGFEGRVVSIAFAEKLKGNINYGLDYAGTIWQERPDQIFTKIMLFDTISGEASESKLKKVRSMLSDASGGRHFVHIINSLDDIAWLFNIRANDIFYSTVAYSFALITDGEAYVFFGDGAVTDEAEAYFKSINVNIGSYELFIRNFGDFVKEKAGLTGCTSPQADRPVVLLDFSRISFDMYKTFSDGGYDVINVKNPTTQLKSIKNAVEIANTKKTQIKDGIAMVKFTKWFKENVGKLEMTECDISDKVRDFRAEQEGFLQPSFETIAGYRDNAAIIHYEPVRGKDKKVRPEGLLLVDSGGQYFGGTTDVTRTIVAGPLTKDEKKCFTLVAAASLRLMNLDSSGINGPFNGVATDAYTRQCLAQYGYDYNHGTGHGIGYALNVHEDPPRIGKDRPDSCAKEKLACGQITSDEPGIYIEGQFGVRTEHDLLVIEKTIDGKKVTAFENLTYVPIDTEGIDKNYLTEEDLNMLNDFNKSVYETLAPYLDEEIKAWLADFCAAI